jgi:NADP-dependent 3-hydroxy acid dehydrogenase YdfG
VFSTNFARNMPPGMVDGLLTAIGVDAQPDADGKLDADVLHEVQQRMSHSVGDVERIADVVEFVVNQPIDIHIEEIVLRPPKQLDM